AYCVEAPQGGVKSAEKAGRDYRGIHNVINPDDLVPYVAPTVMGFKRYGVDHYLFDETYDSNNLKNYNLFSNNLADNRPVEKASDKLKDAVKKQIEDMIPDASKRGKHMPYTMTMYELKVPSFKVDSRKAQMATSIFIQKFLSGFASTVSRADYANNGLQTAARHLMIYKESGGDLGGMASCFSGLGIAGLVGDLIVPSLITVVGTGITSLADSVIEIFTGKRPIQEYINNEFLKTLASKITERIVTRSNAVKSIDKNYPGQSKQAYNDIHTIVYTALKGLPGIDDIITLCKGIEDVFHNHSFVQAIAYLRVADSWYNTNTSLPAAK
ncbi:MAG: hypothetical protein J6328_02730, partial [Bacilli bacterium]|nr:hypothetical protein [Bacilli bacterium]